MCCIVSKKQTLILRWNLQRDIACNINQGMISHVKHEGDWINGYCIKGFFINNMARIKTKWHLIWNNSNARSGYLSPHLYPAPNLSHKFHTSISGYTRYHTDYIILDLFHEDQCYHRCICHGIWWIFWNSKMKMFKFWTKCHWNLIQMIIIHHWFRSCLVTDQATSHYLNQWWLTLLTHTCVTWARWIHILWHFEELCLTLSAPCHLIVYCR